MDLFFFAFVILPLFSIVLVGYAAAHFINRLNDGTSRYGRYALIAAWTIVGSPVVSILLIFGYAIIRDGAIDLFYNRPFTVERWSQLPKDERHRLGKSLIKKRVVEKKTQQEVLKLLGDPTYKYDNDSEKLNGTYWVYNLGIPLQYMSNEELTIRFRNGQADTCWVAISD